MQIDEFLSKSREMVNSVSNKISDEVKDFMNVLQDKVKDIGMEDVGLKIQNKIDKILDKNYKTLDYNVAANTKDYTLLSYEDDGIKCIRVPTSILPEPVNSRTVFNYQDGKFIIDERDTRLKGEEWKEAQKTAKETKEGKLYMIEEMGDHYTTTVDLENGEYVQSQTIGLNRDLWGMQEGDIVIMRDGKCVPYEGEVNIESEKAREMVEGKQAEVQERSIKEEKAGVEKQEQKEREIERKDGSLYWVAELFSEDGGVRVVDFSDGRVRINDEIKKEEFEKLNLGDMIIVKNKEYVKYDGEYKIDNELAKHEVEKYIKVHKSQRNENAVYIADDYINDKIRLRNTEDGTKVNVELREKPELGELFKYENNTYIQYEGIVTVKNEDMKNNLEKIYEEIEKRKIMNFENTKENSTYFVSSVEEDYIFLQNTKYDYQSYNSYDYFFKLDKDKYKDFKLGDFVTVKNGEYVLNDGPLNIGNAEILKDIARLYEYVMKP